MNFSFINFEILKFLLFFLLSYTAHNLCAQNSYEVTYYLAESKLQGPSDNLDNKYKKLIKQSLEYAKNVRYTLLTNQDESYFEQEEVLSNDDMSPIELILSEMAADTPKFNKSAYVNQKEKSFIFVTNLVNQDYTVKRSHFDFKWSIKDDTKKILGFDAKKAIGYYMDALTHKKKKVEAWFIPSIPLQSGPDIFMGLPGLIAEVNLEGALVSAEKINQNLKLKIDKINDSEALTLEEYHNLIKDLTGKFIDGN